MWEILNNNKKQLGDNLGNLWTGSNMHLWWKATSVYINKVYQTYT